jgi:low molecular weight phosphotyrosine protein phosphatase
MDRDNLYDVERLNKSGSGKAKVMLFGEFNGKKRPDEVDDPYYVSTEN